jgi:hypothetical protein
MRGLHLIWALVLCLIGGTAHATTFNYTGALQYFDVTQTGVYDITAYGAQGGGFGYGSGGVGAVVGGSVTLIPKAKS